jgi:HlyD family secretion protein
VTQGQALASLDGADLQAQEAQAQASLEGAQARLADLQSGLRPEDAALQDLKVASAQDAQTQTKLAAVNTITATYATADDAVRGKADQFFSTPTSPTPHLTFFVADDVLKAHLESERLTVETLLKNWQADVATLTPDSDLVTAAQKARANLTSVNAFLTDMALAVDKISLAANPSLTSATLAGYQTNLSLARTGMTAAISATSGVESQLSAAENALKLTQSQQALAVAGASTETVTAAEATVHQAEAALSAIRVQESKTVIRSPLDGVITRQDGHVGQIVAPNLPLVSVISGSAYEIKTTVSEADVADVQVGNAASVTLDAYGTGTTFDATVTTVNPAATSQTGSPSYQVTLQFKTPDERIKSGLTANVTVVSGTRTQVIVIPSQDVVRRGDKTYVMAATATGPQEKEVTLGLLGQDGHVEVTSGLSENDRIADFGGRQ